MCIIIYQPRAAQPIPESRLRESFTANPDGWGLMWNNGRKFFYDKGVQDFPSFLAAYWGAQQFGNEVAVHFRTASSVRIDVAACHPHLVEPGFGFMMNGNFFEFQKYFGKGYADDQTDAERFNQVVLRKLLRRDGSEKAFDLLEKYVVGNQVKVLLMDAESSLIINDQAGEWKDGHWYSNKGLSGYTGYGYSGAYPYQPDEVRHKGGLITIENLVNKNGWRQCTTCLGWFKGLEFDASCSSCQIYLALLEEINVL